jgi:integral membrane protein (TIGR01906 family)
LKTLTITAKWLFVLCLPALLLTASIAFAVNSAWLYEYGFQKYGVSQTTGLSQAELHKAAVGLIAYFNSGEESINLVVEKDGQPFVLFNEREVAHLRDVKGLFRLDYTVLLWTFVYGLVYTLWTVFWRKGVFRRYLARGLAWGGGLTIALLLAVGLLWLLFGFDRLFWQFHVFSFANDFWQLDPTRDYLIRLFPQGFWFDVTVFIALFTAFLAVVLGGVGFMLRRINRSRKKNEM